MFKKKISILLIISFFLSLTFSYSYAHHLSKNDDNKKWAEKIINGGYILVVRHGHRDKWENINAFDIYSIVNNERAEEKSYKSSVCLSNKGKEQIKMLNNVFKFLKIQISQVVSSPSCRARQTALLGFDRIDSINNSIAGYMFSNRVELQKKFKEFLKTIKIEPNANVVISGHGGTLASSIIDIDKIPRSTRKFWEFWKPKPHTQIGHVGESGFTILEKKGNSIIARHTFFSLKDFVDASMSYLPNK